MKKATISETKNHLSALLDYVRKGGDILILDRKVPIARLVPVTSEQMNISQLAQLERAGLVRGPVDTKKLSLLDRPPPKLKNGVSLTKIILEDRDTER